MRYIRLQRIISGQPLENKDMIFVIRPINAKQRKYYCVAWVCPKQNSKVLKVPRKHPNIHSGNKLTVLLPFRTLWSRQLWLAFNWARFLRPVCCPIIPF